MTFVPELVFRNENAVQAGVGNGPDGVQYGAGWRLATTIQTIGLRRPAHYVAHRIPPQQKSWAALARRLPGTSIRCLRQRRPQDRWFDGKS